MFDLAALNEALGLLGSRLDIEGASPVDIVVCGGASLIVTELIVRTTKDVDVLAMIERSVDDRSISAKRALLPESLKKAAAQVAEDLGLDENWLNTGPKDLVEYGLPAGFEKRLQSRKYGKLLTIYFVGRLDQIHFKVYASVDSGPGRHVTDLLALKPTEKEIELAARWSMIQDPSDAFRARLIEMLRTLKYESADRI
jgi:hypothetical protein